MASTRYLHGDGFTADAYATTSTIADNPVGIEMQRCLEGDNRDLAVVPGLRLSTDRPTTVGLGDTFVGGFLAAWSRGTAGPPL